MKIEPAILKKYEPLIVYILRDVPKPDPLALGIRIQQCKFDAIPLRWEGERLPRGACGCLHASSNQGDGNHTMSHFQAAAICPRRLGSVGIQDSQEG